MMKTTRNKVIFFYLSKIVEYQLEVVARIFTIIQGLCEDNVKWVYMYNICNLSLEFTIKWSKLKLRYTMLFM